MKLKGFVLALAMLAVTVGLAACSGCAGLQTQHQKIGAACDSAASALQTITAAKQAGRVKADDLAKAVKVYEGTVPFCQPVAEKLSDVEYDKLIGAALDLTVTANKAKPEEVPR